MKHRTLPAILFLGGLSALTLSIIGNYMFNSSLTHDATINMTNGGISITLDILVVAFASAFGASLARKKYGSAIVVGILTLLLGSFSLASSIGYSASGRIAATRAQAHVTQAEKERASERTAALTRQSEWLKSQIADAPRSTRQGFLTESTAALKEAHAAPATPTNLDAVAKQIMPDAGAQIIAEMAGVDVEKAQLGIAIAIACLLIIAKVGAFSVACNMWVREEATAPPLPAKRAMVPTGALPNIEIAEAPAPSDVDVEPAQNVVPLRRYGPIEAVNAFLATVNESIPYTQTDLFQGYKLFCKSVGVEPRSKTFFVNNMRQRGFKMETLGGGDTLAWRPGSSAAVAA